MPTSTLSIILSQFSDFSTIVFALTATVIAVLTYQRAKETFLQPVRSEVIKKQTDLLISLTTLLDKEYTLLEKIDYHGLVRLNIFSSLILSGNIFKEQDKIKHFVKENSKGGIFFKNEKGEVDAESISIFNDTKKKQPKDINRKYYESAKLGKFRMPMLELTREHVEFMDKLSKIKEDPFLPKDIGLHLEQLNQDIHINITQHLRRQVEKAVNEFFERGEKDIPVDSGVFNAFNHERISHQDLLSKIREETRKYLKIDSMP